MFRSLTFVPVMMCAVAIVAAQAPAQEKPTAYPPAGQQPTTQQPTAQQPVRPSEGLAANKVTYTGCVKPGTAPGTWMLDNAEVSTQAKPGQATAGTSGTMKTTLNLSTKPETDLKPHTNHKVEVVGTIAPAKSAMSSSSTSAQQPAAGQAARQDFTVETVKMVSATCP